MTLYSKEELNALGYLFYEDVLPAVEKFISSSIFYSKDIKNVEEDIFYSEPFQNYVNALELYQESIDKKGPMDLNDLIHYKTIRL